MDDRIKSFIDTLAMHLEGLAEDERKEALDYYREYFSDAMEEGADPGELLSRLDPPEKIAAAIMAGSSIRLVQTEPGLKNYSKLVKTAHAGFAGTLSAAAFSLLIFTTYSIAILLFLGTVLAAAAACIILPASISEALKIPASYPGGIAGTIGIGISASGIFVLTACGFYILSRPLFRASAVLVYKLIRKGGKPARDTAGSSQDASGTKTAKPAGRFVKAVAVITAVGLVVALASGLPVKLFLIFNSMKPADVTVIKQEYDISGASEIRIYTAHTNIRLREGGSGKISFEYEKADWLDFDIKKDGDSIVFTERSNGRLPLFSLVSLHENRAGLVISLPPGYDPDKVSLESRGGTISIESSAFPVDAKTYTGRINLAVPADADPDSIRPAILARTAKGTVFLRDKATGARTPHGAEYEGPSPGGIAIRLESERGDIILD